MMTGRATPDRAAKIAALAIKSMVGVLVYLLGLFITILWGGDLIQHTAWTVMLPIQLGNMLIGAGGVLVIREFL